MIRREAGRLVLSGKATLGSIAALIDEGLRHLREGVSEIDLSEVRELDSSLLAALLAWHRDARSRGAELRVDCPPPGLLTLAALYGVGDLIGVSRPA